MSAARRLRELLASRETILAPGAYDALAARILERGGFEAIYTGGYAAAASNFGLPDIGLVTQTEMADHVGRIAGAVSVPVISDADTGYGDVASVARTVQAYERGGVAAVQIEDQVMPKKCGHMEGKRVIPRDEMVQKVRAALDARTDPDTVIVARSDAIAVTGLDDAIDRMRAYAEAGADVIFPDAPRSEEELRRIAAAIDVPLVVNMSEGGKTPILPVATLTEIGYRIVIYPTASLSVAAKAVEELAEVLRRDGTTDAVADRMIVFDELNELVGLDRWQALEARTET